MFLIVNFEAQTRNTIGLLTFSSAKFLCRELLSFRRFNPQMQVSYSPQSKIFVKIPQTGNESVIYKNEKLKILDEKDGLKNNVEIGLPY